MKSVGVGMLVLVLVLGFHAASAEKSKSRSPFSRTPADVAKEEPCRFMGTFHKESRQRLEVLHSCHRISIEQWKCMANGLKTLDAEMTKRCREEPQTLEGIETRQRELYKSCLASPDEAVLGCSLLSSDQACLKALCSPRD